MGGLAILTSQGAGGGEAGNAVVVDFIDNEFMLRHVIEGSD
ncbi:hypothetical protein OAN15_02185 [bacterium]|nr:hypothetical protein [bacterium]